MTSTGLKYLMYSPYYAGDENWNDADWEKYDSLVDNLGVRELLLSTQTTTIIERILLDNGLDDQVGQGLALIIRNVAIKKLSIEDMGQTIQKTLGISTEKSDIIGSKIITELFEPARKQSSQYPDQDLPETGGNIIDLRNQK